MEKTNKEGCNDNNSGDSDIDTDDLVNDQFFEKANQMLLDKRQQLEEKKQNFKSFLDFHDLEYPKQILLMGEISTHIDHVEKVNAKMQPIVKQLVQLFEDKVSRQKKLDSSALAVDYISQDIDEFKLTQDDLNLVLNAKPTDISIDQYQIAIAV